MWFRKIVKKRIYRLKANDLKLSHKPTNLVVVSNGGAKNRIAQNGLANFFNLFSNDLIESVILPKEKAYSIVRLKCPEWSRVIVDATQSTRFVTGDFKGNQLNLICFHLADINQSDEKTCILSDKVQQSSTDRPVAYPNGLRLIDDFISPEEESRIINRLQSFENTRLAKRSILQFGRKIDFATKRFIFIISGPAL